MAGFGLLLVALLGDSSEFSPYVRSKTADHCLWWPNQTLTYAQSVVGNSTTGNTAFSAVSTSFATWQLAMQQCGSLTFTEGARATIRATGNDGQNVVLFRASSCKKKVPASHACWAAGTCGNQFDCWDHASALLGVTTVSYDTATGRLADADIELNAFDNVFTTVDSPVCSGRPNQACVATDVQNTVTHEIGHLMGLDHTKLNGSTMGATASAGELSKRVLDVGTKSFVCEVYEKNMPPRDCVLEPAVSELGRPAAVGCSSAKGDALALTGLLAFGLLVRRARAPNGVTADLAVRGAFGANHARSAALALGLTLSSSAHASTIVAMGIAELRAESDLVVRGTVVRVSARWATDHSRIITDVEVAVREVWQSKGTQSPSTITVTQPGGEVGDIGQRVDGSPVFVAGEEVVLFLEAHGTARYVVTGFSQGKFEVADGGWVLPTVVDAHLEGRPQAPLQVMTLDGLKQLVSPR